MPSFYLQFHIYGLKKKLFSRTYPLIYGNPWSFYMRIHYMPAYFWSPYLSNITRSTCIVIAILQCKRILRNLSKSKFYLIKIITKAKNEIKEGVNSRQSNMYIGNELKCYKIRLITQGAHQFMTSWKCILKLWLEF